MNFVPAHVPIATASAPPALSTTDALTLLLTVETLLLAALAVSVALAAPSEHGGPPAVRGPRLARSITAVIVLVAVGATSAWLDLYTGSGHSPDGVRAWTIAIGLAAGVVASPILSIWITRGVE